MSVYSGFATRKQEAFYNKLTAKLLHLMTQKYLSSVPYNEIGNYITHDRKGSSASELNGESEMLDESIDQQLVQLGMGKDIELHDEMRSDNNTIFKNFAHLRPPTSSSTLPTGRV
jgi:hypothetical protein